MSRSSRPYRSGDGWRFVYRGRKYWRRTEGEAWSLLGELRRQTGGETERAGPPLTIGSLVADWLALHPSAHARERLADLLDFAECRSLASIGDGFLVEFHAALRMRRHARTGEPWRPETIRKDVRYAGSVLAWGAARGYVAAQRERPRLAATPWNPKSLSDAELADAFASMQRPGQRCKWALPLARFILETGSRPGEARLLRWSQVDTSRRVAVLGAHKTANRTGEPRILPLSSTALEILASVRGRSQTYCFVGYAGAPYSRDGFASILRRHGLSVYRLRHTWCQRATEAGLADGVILEVLGHVDSQMLRRYRRITEAQQSAAAAALDGLSRVRRHADRPPPKAAPSRARRGDRSGGGTRGRSRASSGGGDEVRDRSAAG